MLIGTANSGHRQRGHRWMAAWIGIQEKERSDSCEWRASPECGTMAERRGVMVSVEAATVHGPRELGSRTCCHDSREARAM
jgi:hypothetical protein